MVLKKEDAFIAAGDDYQPHFHVIPMRGANNPAIEGSKTTSCARCSARCYIAGLAHVVGEKQKPSLSVVAPGTREAS